MGRRSFDRDEVQEGAETDGDWEVGGEKSCRRRTTLKDDVITRRHFYFESVWVYVEIGKILHLSFRSGKVIKMLIWFSDVHRRDRL